jgi:hypothetical protein
MINEVELDMAKGIGKAAREVSGMPGQWRDRFRRFAAGKQSVSEFCAAESVSVPTFYYWRKRLQLPTWTAGANLGPSAAQFIDAGVTPLMPSDGAGTARGGVELRIDLGGGLVLQILRP